MTEYTECEHCDFKVKDEDIHKHEDINIFNIKTNCNCCEGFYYVCKVCVKKRKGYFFNKKINRYVLK